MNETIDVIKTLIVDLNSSQIGVQEFCQRYENYWNFEADKDGLSDCVFEALDRLFDEVVLFSPFPREEWGYPKYRDGDEILQAIDLALRSIEPA